MNKDQSQSDMMEKEETIQVIYNGNMVLIALGDTGVELTRSEAEKLLFDLAHALQDQDVRKQVGG